MIAMFRKYWYIIVIAISVTGNLLFIYTGNEDYYQEYMDKIEALQKEVDELEGKNVGLKVEIKNLEKESDSLDLEIDAAKQARIDIIRSYEIYLDNILDLDDSELEQWFITRYSDKLGDKDSEVSSD